MRYTSLDHVEAAETSITTVDGMPLDNYNERRSVFLQSVRMKLKANEPVRIFLAETMGTFILMVFGIGSVAQFVFSRDALGSYLSVNMGWGFGVVFGIYWSIGVSGGHINPAVTLAMTITGRTKLKLLPIYWAAQSLGAFIASAVCYGIYYDALNNFDGGTRSTAGTAGIWSTYPQEFVSNGTGFADQVFGTALLVGTVFALTDKKNNAPKTHLFPLLVGILVWAIGMTFGFNCGYGINPARDLIPRIFTSIAGWGSGPFKAHNYWFWCPVVAQFLGSVIGAIVYLLMVEIHHDDDIKVSVSAQFKKSTDSQIHIQCSEDETDEMIN